MLTLVIEQLRTELRWAQKLAREIGKRENSEAPASFRRAGRSALVFPFASHYGAQLRYRYAYAVLAAPSASIIPKTNSTNMQKPALARRMRTVAELKRLMRARVEEPESEYGETLIELVIRRLKDQGYLNDSRYAAYYFLDAP